MRPAALSFRQHMGVAIVAVLFAWLSALAPYRNWCRFPTSPVEAAPVEQVIDGSIAGAAMAWWLGR